MPWISQHTGLVSKHFAIRLVIKPRRWSICAWYFDRLLGYYGLTRADESRLIYDVALKMVYNGVIITISFDDTAWITMLMISYHSHNRITYKMPSRRRAAFIDNGLFFEFYVMLMGAYIAWMKHSAKWSSLPWNYFLHILRLRRSRLRH